MDVQYQRCIYGNGATLLIFKLWNLAYGRAYARRDSHVKTKSFEFDGLPNFLRYGAPLVGVSFAIMAGVNMKAIVLLVIMI